MSMPLWRGDGAASSMRICQRRFLGARAATSPMTSSSFSPTGSSMPAKYRNVSGLFLDQKTRGGLIADCGEGSFGQLCRLYGAETARAKVRDLRRATDLAHPRPTTTWVCRRS